jgi:hypothetical protein
MSDLPVEFSFLSSERRMVFWRSLAAVRVTLLAVSEVMMPLNSESSFSMAV